MPKIASASSLEGRIHEIVQRAAVEIAAAVRNSIAEEVTRSLQAGAGEYRPPARSGRPASGGKPRKRPPILCPVSGCGQPGAGPKFGWFCREHNQSLSAGEKTAARAAARTRPRGAAAVLAKKVKAAPKAKPRRKAQAQRKRRSK